MEDSFPELPTVLIWLRFLLAISYGTYLGINGAMGGAIALSTLIWIYFFTALHAEAEGKLASILISTVVQQFLVDGNSGGSDEAAHETLPVEDSEF